MKLGWSDASKQVTAIFIFYLKFSLALCNSYDYYYDDYGDDYSDYGYDNYHDMNSDYTYYVLGQAEFTTSTNFHVTDETTVTTVLPELASTTELVTATDSISTTQATTLFTTMVTGIPETTVPSDAGFTSDIATIDTTESISTTQATTLFTTMVTSTPETTTLSTAEFITEVITIDTTDSTSTNMADVTLVNFTSELPRLASTEEFITATDSMSATQATTLFTTMVASPPESTTISTTSLIDLLTETMPGW